MKGISYLIILIFLILAELFLVSSGVRFNLVLIAVLIWFILSNFKESVIWLLVSGFFLDIFSPLPFGVITLSLFFSLSLIHLLSLKVFSQKSLGAVILITVIGSLAYNLFLILGTKFFALLRITSLNIDLMSNLYLILPTIGYNLVLTFFVYKILKYCTFRFRFVK